MRFSKIAKDLVQPLACVLHEEDTIEASLDKLRKTSVNKKIFYFYVTSPSGKLTGIVSTRKLLLSDPLAKVASIMQKDVLAIRAHQTLREAMKLFSERHLLALPVIDEEGLLLGTIDVEMYLEKSLDIANARHRFDLFQMMGVSVEDEKKASLMKNFTKRIPWILCNIAGGLFCAVISHFYSFLLTHVIVLAMFIPLVLSLSESVSMQSLAHGLQIITGDFFSMRWLKLTFFKESKIVLLLSFTCALLIGLTSLLWKGGIHVSLVIGISIFASVILSAFFAMAFPILLHKIKMDPKIASGPVVLAVADMITTVIYLGLASFWLFF
jgi:magnesium transporter